MLEDWAQSIADVRDLILDWMIPDSVPTIVTKECFEMTTESKYETMKYVTTVPSTIEVKVMVPTAVIDTNDNAST